MQSVDIRDYIRQKGFIFKTHGDEIVLQYCPYCEYQDEGNYSHFYFNTAKETFYCHHCGQKGNIFRFMIDQGDSPVTKTKQIKYVRPKENPSITSNTDEFYAWYEKERSICQYILKKYNVGFRKEKGSYCYIYQYYNEKGELFNRKYYIPATKDKKRNLWTEKDAEHGFYGLQFVDFSKKYLHICEGEDDCHALVQLGFDNVVSVEDSELIASMISNATFVMIEDSGHMPHEERPNEFMNVVSSWLNTLINE